MVHKAVHRKHEASEYWSGWTRFLFGFLMLVAEVLLLGALALVLYWVLQYRGGFAWNEKDKIDLEFNFHPVLMVGGFIFFLGQAMLIYRSCRCCGRIWNKLFHTLLHLMAIPCIAIGFVSVLEYHNLKEPAIPNFYSLHSWCGLVTMGLFALQFVVGFFSFLLLLCCERYTASFRAALVPVHATFGLTTFMLAIATCLSGLTEKALFTFNMPKDGVSPSDTYADLPEEGIIINALAMCLVAVGILIPFIIRYGPFQRSVEPETISVRL